MNQEFRLGVNLLRLPPPLSYCHGNSNDSHTAICVLQTDESSSTGKDVLQIRWSQMNCDCFNLQTEMTWRKCNWRCEREGRRVLQIRMSESPQD